MTIFRRSKGGKYGLMSPFWQYNVNWGASTDTFTDNAMSNDLVMVVVINGR